jgi:hypothetical protein
VERKGLVYSGSLRPSIPLHHLLYPWRITPSRWQLREPWKHLSSLHHLSSSSSSRRSRSPTTPPGLSPRLAISTTVTGTSTQPLLLTSNLSTFRFACASPVVVPSRLRRHRIRRHSPNRSPKHVKNGLLLLPLHRFPSNLIPSTTSHNPQSHLSQTRLGNLPFSWRPRWISFSGGSYLFEQFGAYGINTGTSHDHQHHSGLANPSASPLHTLSFQHHPSDNPRAPSSAPSSGTSSDYWNQWGNRYSLSLFFEVFSSNGRTTLINTSTTAAWLDSLALFRSFLEQRQNNSHQLVDHHSFGLTLSLFFEVFSSNGRTTLIKDGNSRLLDWITPSFQPLL